MSLSSEVSRKVTTGPRRINPGHLLAFGWFMTALFALIVAISMLLRRLGLDPTTATALLVTLSIIAVFAAGWFGRTMSANTFFTMNRTTPSSLVGLSGFTDWCGGAILAVLFAFGATGRVTLTLAISTGLVLQAAVLAPIMQRPGVVTLPGLFAWRTSTQSTGMAALITTLATLFMLALAEAFVGIAMVETITKFDRETITIIFVALAVVPTLAGGWMALLLINLTFGLIILFALLAPATALALLPSTWLAHDPLLKDALVVTLPVAQEFTLGDGGVFDTLLAFIIFATGLASLPVGLSRLALNINGTTATESVGWSALATFLALASLPVAALAFVVPGSNAAQAAQAHPLLGALSILALLLAAYNALAATLFMASTSVIRALRRTQRKNPSERSMASIRMLTLALGLAVIAFTRHTTEPAIDLAGPFWLAGLCFAASGLFVPLVAAGWISHIPWPAYASALIIGPLVIGLVMLSGPDAPLLQAAFLGQVLSFVCIATGKFVPALLGRKSSDPNLSTLRRPQGS